MSINDIHRQLGKRSQPNNTLLSRIDAIRQWYTAYVATYCTVSELLFVHFMANNKARLRITSNIGIESCHQRKLKKYASEHIYQ